MSRTPLFFLVLSALIAISAFVGYIDNRDAKGSQPLSLKIAPSPQRHQERLWRPIQLEQKSMLGAEGTLTHPSIVKEDSLGRIYVLDSGDRAVKRFDRLGAFERVFMRNRGSEQFMLPTDFSVTDEGDIWIVDASRGKISVFDDQGMLRREIATPNRPLRLLTLHDLYIVQLLAPVDHLFEVYSRSSGEVVARFGSLIADQPANYIALEGWLASNDSETFVYAPLYAGLIASFSKNGSLNYINQTIHRIPLPRIDIDRDAVRRVSKHSPVSSFSVCLSAGKIFITASPDGTKRLRSIVDVYDSASGNYLYSWKLPTSYRHAFIYGENLYAVGTNFVEKWKIRSAGNP